MNKKTAIVSVLLGVLLIGIVSAGLVGYLSNMVSGSVMVEGPVFYLNGYDSGIYHDLFINNPPSSEEDVYLWDGQRLMFKTGELNINSFYPARFDIKIWAKTNSPGNILQFQIVKVKPDLEEEIICVPTSVTLTNLLNYVKKETYCESDGEITLNPEDKIGLVIMGAGSTSDYWISTGEKRISTNELNGYSRIEVSPTQ